MESTLGAVGEATDTIAGASDPAILTSTGFVNTQFGGRNSYVTRGGQQLTVTWNLTGGAGDFTLLTAGSVTINIFYAIVP